MWVGDVHGDNDTIVFFAEYTTAYLTFFPAIDVYCQKQPNDPNYKEIAELMILAGDEVCRLISILGKATVSGEFDYHEDEYPQFLSTLDAMPPISEEQFIASIKHYREAWTDISVLKSAVQELIEILKQLTFSESWWYHPQETLQMLQVIYAALEELERQSARTARINIE